MSHGSEPADADGEDVPLVCSARGCHSLAAHAVLWNNPKIHAPDRRKTWLACTDHEESLRGFLSARGFWRSTEALQRPG